MAIYKPTNCTPFLVTFDCRVGENDAPVFFECRIDSSNRNAAGYSVTIYDENNTQVFPPDGSFSNENISQVSDLLRITGTGNAAISTPYLIQNTGYTNLNTGLNGTYLKFPFILNDSFWDATQVSDSGHTIEQQYFFNSSNTIYYKETDEGNGKLYWYKNGEAIEVPLYNGNSYKWVITLYQGDSKNITPIPVNDSSAYKYYDMLLTTGEVMGSYAERIQTVYSENIYIDYYIEPVAITFLTSTDKDSFNPASWNGTVSSIPGAAGTRTRIKNIDSTFGYIYPQIDDLSYNPNVIQRGQAAGYRIYRYGNNEENLTTTRMVNFAPNQKAIPFEWQSLVADESTSYGKQTLYVLASGNSIPLNFSTGTYTLQTADMSSSNFCPFEFVGVNSGFYSAESNGERSDEQPRWFLYGNNYTINTSSRILLNFQPNQDTLPVEGATDSSIAVTASNGGSAFNGIFVPRFSKGETVSMQIQDPSTKEWLGPFDFIQYTFSWDRASDADTWGELGAKVVMIKNGWNQGINVQTTIMGDDGVIDSGTLNDIEDGKFYFIEEKPVQLYNYDNSINKEINTVGLIFYTGGECSTSSSPENAQNKVYISPFTGIKNGMYWIEQGNISAINKKRFIIKNINTDYWYVTYENGQENGTYPTDIINIFRETPYQIKSFFRESDENPFDLYEDPTISLKIYRNEAHSFSNNSEVPNGKYEDAPAGTLYMDNNGAYQVQESYGSSDVKLLRVDRRSIWAEAEYNQSDFISWRSFEWFLYDGINTDGELLQSSGTLFDGRLGYQFYGLEQNHIYTIVFVLETNTGFVITKNLHIITDFDIDALLDFPFTIEYQCDTQSVYMRFGLSGFVLPNISKDTKRSQNDEDLIEGTTPPINGVTYSQDDLNGWMHIDGSNPSFPQSGVTYQYISSTLNADTMSATQMTTGEENGTFTFESRHIVNAVNSWGNIVGFQYIPDEYNDDDFTDEKQVQIFLPNYNTIYTYKEKNYNYINDVLLYQMQYQAGEMINTPTIKDKDTLVELSDNGIWAIENGKTIAPLIVSGWLQDGLSYAEIGDAVRPNGYEIIAIDNDGLEEHYSPVEDGEKLSHYKETLFYFLGNNEKDSEKQVNSTSPVLSWSERENVYDVFSVLPKNDPVSATEGEEGHLYGGPEEGEAHIFQVKESSDSNVWVNFEVIGANPSLWSDNKLERKNVITGGQRVLSWETNPPSISYTNKTIQSREVENIDIFWSWDDGSGTQEDGVFTDIDATPYDVSNALSKFWIDGDIQGVVLLSHQAQYSSSANESWASVDLRAGMDAYDFTFHVAVKNAFVGPYEDDIQVQVFRGKEM